MKEDDAMVYRRPYLTSGSSGFALNAISRAMKKELETYVEEMRKILMDKNWGVPTTICWGQRDRWLTYDGVKDFCEISKHRLIELPMLHSKKRNRLEQQRLNDLVYVKYNRTLRFRYDMRNTLDPISLQNIDESNEWLLGRMDGESDEDNEPVFDDDDGLTWATVARASGVEESSHASRATSSRSKAQPKISKSSTLTPLQLIDEEEAGSDDTEEEDVEGYKSTDGEEDDSLLAIDVEDDD